MKRALIILVLLFATPASAQENSTVLFLSVAPQYPKPNEAVFITLQSPLLDLSERSIRWTSGGEVVLEGEGESTLRIQAPASGGSVTVTAAVQDYDDRASISISPASVDLMWESDSYAPGLYRGRHAPSAGSRIRLQAVPHLVRNGAELSHSQLTYTWRRNGNVMTKESGRGKTSISLPISSFAESDEISVSVINTEKTLSAEGRAIIASAEPVVRLYIDHPLYGILYHRALPETMQVSDTEMSFAAIPYFVTAQHPNESNFSYVWRVNRQDIEPNKDRPNTLTINAGPAGGEAALELSLSHKQNFLFDGRGAWTINFGSITANEASETAF